MLLETSFSADACSFRTPGGHGITVNDVQVIFKRLRRLVQVLLTQIIARFLLEQIISRAMFQYFRHWSGCEVLYHENTERLQDNSGAQKKIKIKEN